MNYVLMTNQFCDCVIVRECEQLTYAEKGYHVVINGSYQECLDAKNEG